MESRGISHPYLISRLRYDYQCAIYLCLISAWSTFFLLTRQNTPKEPTNILSKPQNYESRWQISSRSESVSHFLLSMVTIISMELTSIAAPGHSLLRTSGQQVLPRNRPTHSSRRWDLSRQLMWRMQLQCHIRRALRPIWQIRSCTVRYDDLHKYYTSPGANL